MPILKIYQGQTLQAALSQMILPVQVIYTALDQPEPDTLKALADLEALTSYLSVKLNQDPTLEADRLLVRAENGRELVFWGAPLGLELAALFSAVIVAGRGQSGLALATRQALARLTAPVHLQVFTTPT
jgi:alkyl hydroperoxide reductase subunit AhpF